MKIRKYQFYVVLFVISFLGCTSNSIESNLPPVSAVEAPTSTLKANDVSDGLVTYPVYFGTTRARSADKNFFLDERNSEKNITYGLVKVIIPAHHKRGSIGTVWGNLTGFNPYLQIKRPYEVFESEGSFAVSIANALNGQDKSDSIVVYIHGYNNSFEDAAIRAAQLGVDTGIPENHMFLFSWPSIKKTSTYTQDESSIDVNEIYFSKYLETISNSLPNKKINIIAHSMGNRALLRVINKGIVSASKKRVSFGQVILAAADVDAELFSQSEMNYVNSSVKTTVYISPYDFAVGASQFVHKYPRLGCSIAPPAVMNPRIDYVLSTLEADFPAHSYMAENGLLLDDLQSLFLSGKPDRRDPEWKRLGANYWTVGPALNPSGVRCDNR